MWTGFAMAASNAIGHEPLDRACRSGEKFLDCR